MKTYTANFSVEAREMTRLEYDEFRGWTVPDDEDGSDTGFIIVDKSGISNTSTEVGYVSWLPTEEFKRKYIQIGEFSNLVQNP